MGIGSDIRPERVREICDGQGWKSYRPNKRWNRILNDTENLIKEHDILGRYIGAGRDATSTASKEMDHPFYG